jgi:hypothetical protein
LTVKYMYGTDVPSTAGTPGRITVLYIICSVILFKLLEIQNKKKFFTYKLNRAYIRRRLFLWWLGLIMIIISLCFSQKMMRLSQ